MIHYYRRWADRETYGIIGDKAAQVENMDRRFTIEQTNTITLEGYPRVESAAEFLGTNGIQEIGASILSLTEGSSRSRRWRTNPA